MDNDLERTAGVIPSESKVNLQRHYIRSGPVLTQRLTYYRVSALRRQQTMHNVPPGPRAPRTARMAGTGAAKNCVPIRENA